MPRLFPRTLRTFAALFWADTRGAILPYVTIMLVVIVGVSVLALDGARLMSFHTQLQKGTDALALAAAAELDREPGAIVRANTAICNLVTNNSTLFGTGGAATIDCADVTWRYLSDIPSDDSQPVAAGDVICVKPCASPSVQDDIDARFVEVTVSPALGLAAVLPASFFGGSATSAAGSTAVAGNDGVVCKFIPMFVCNPYETAGMTYDQALQALVDAAANPEKRRQGLQLKNDGQYGPGNFGFLNTSLGNGESALGQAIANVNPALCLKQNGVNTQPGSITAVRVAFNVRFDRYDGSMNSVKGNSNYRPAQNVRKGWACNANNPPAGWPYDITSGAMPRDDCFQTASCPYAAGRMGDGCWNFGGMGGSGGYWRTNHPSRAVPTIWDSYAKPSGCPYDPPYPSRYEVYRYEVDNGLINDGGPDPGVPACYTGSGLSDNPDRRILYVAIVNCNTAGAGGVPLNGNQTNVPVAAFGKFFLSLPVENGVNMAVDSELVGLAKPGGGGGGASGVAADMIQLYR